MLPDVIFRKQFHDMTGLWFHEKGKIAFTLVPSGMADKIPSHRDTLNNEEAVRFIYKVWKKDFTAWSMENAIQYHLAGDPLQGSFGAGESMRNNASTKRLTYKEIRETADGIRLVMTDTEKDIEAIQTVRHTEGQPFIVVQTSLTNKGKEDVTVDYLTSFSLGFLSLFHADCGHESYRLLRWLSNWSNEGRLQDQSAEEAGMEMSWSGSGSRALRYGQHGSMPVRGYFPQIGFRDTTNNVVWGASLDVMASWEMEFFRRSDFFNLSGGYVDREFGGWKKILHPGETLTSPAAALTCAKGDAETLTNRLQHYCDAPCPALEDDLPVMFNDWCTTWGHPYPDRLLPIADKLANRGVRYFVMDDGWFKHHEDPDWPNVIGDWNVSPVYGPDGLKKLVQDIRKKGFIPGVWFEMENAMPGSHIAEDHPELFLTLDGTPMLCGDRIFLDFRKPEVEERLTKKVIDFLKENGFGYMKVDYNAATGFGCDGAESPAEGLDQHFKAVARFYEKIHRELPDLVLEICASGGHRLAPWWMRQASMGSFSDAHEGVEIPLIAANTAALIPARKSQIWAVLHPENSIDRIIYSLSAGFLGRLCLSGDIAELSKEQNEKTDQAIALYRKCTPVIKNGENHCIRQTGSSYTAPKGYQMVIRSNANGKLVVLHTFENAPDQVLCPVEKGWKLTDSLLPERVTFEQDKEDSIISGLRDFNGAVLLFEKE